MPKGQAVADPAAEARRRTIQRDLLGIEAHRHRMVQGMLELVLEEVPMAPELAREVCLELTERRRLAQEAEGCRRRAGALATYFTRRAETAGAAPRTAAG